MRRSLFCLAAALLWLPAVLSASEPSDRPTVVRFRIQSRDEIHALTRLVSIDDVRGLEVRAYASPLALKRLTELGYAWEVLPDPGLNPEARMDLEERAPLGVWDSYPTYSGYVAMMQGYATNYPLLARLVEIGNTTNTSRPHKLLALKISDNPDAEEDEPEVLYTSTMHGDETTGSVTLLHLIDEILTNYDPLSTDPYKQRITRLVNEGELWINPFANPDGSYYVSDASVSGSIRYYTTTTGTNSWVDPNRNLPDPQDGPHPDGNVYWAETQAMMNFAAAHSFIISANFHGGAEVVNYPWDTWVARHADDAWYQVLSRQYATLAQTNGPAGYMTDLDNGITNGYDWYEVDGGRQDYMNYGRGCREVTIEISSTKNPPSSQLPTFWTANRDALLTYLENALKGVRGRVTNQLGAPLAAQVTIPGHDHTGSSVTTDPEVGDYHRLLSPGNYPMSFSAAGYLTRDFSNVVVTTGDATRLDVVLYTDLIFADGF
ncbi:MAG TPA: M14 family zinc carboxypeptidase [Vicinamibacteria bacterium]|nr:M14 family zinc carboxypeptidase [Vicinamibacteria bacterium]